MEDKEELQSLQDNLETAYDYALYLGGYDSEVYQQLTEADKKKLQTISLQASYVLDQMESK